MTRVLSVRKLVIIVAVVVGVGAVVAFAAERLYFAESRRLTEEIAEVRDNIARYESVLPRHFEVRDALRARAAASLGPDLDQNEHSLRTTLSALAERAGLSEVVVSTGRPSAIANPAARERIARSIRRALSDRTDFRVVSGRISGTGAWDRVLEFLVAVESQPWIDRLDGFDLRPGGRDRTTFDIAVDFSVVVMDDAPTDNGAVLELASGDEALRAVSSLVVARAPFVDPPPEPEPEPEPRAVTPPPVVVRAPPPPPAYHEWRLTALISRDQGEPEAWVRHMPTGQVRRLRAGEGVLGAQLVSVQTDRAEFAIGDERFGVSLRRTLAERLPTGR